MHFISAFIIINLKAVVKYWNIAIMVVQSFSNRFSVLFLIIVTAKQFIVTCLIFFEEQLSKITLQFPSPHHLLGSRSKPNPHSVTSEDTKPISVWIDPDIREVVGLASPNKLIVGGGGVRQHLYTTNETKEEEPKETYLKRSHINWENLCFNRLPRVVFQYFYKIKDLFEKFE